MEGFAASRSGLKLRQRRWPKLLLSLGQALQVDSQLLAFFVKVAAFEAQGFGCLGYIPIVPVELGQHRGPFKSRHALGKRTGCAGVRQTCRFNGGVRGRQRQSDCLGVHLGSGQQE